MSSGSRPANIEQPDSFVFTPENQERARVQIAKYPEGRQASALCALLDLAQRQSGGWLPEVAMDQIAEMLDVARIRVYEVATFYSMFNVSPVGKHHVRVCTTTPCQLRGAGTIVAACVAKLGIGMGETSADGEFTLGEVECLGACVNAPVLQVGDDYYEDIDADSTGRILDALKRGESPAPGPQIARQTSAPSSGPTTLLDSAR
ncbi:MAG: NADH-quinone oxidoreductase subunit NuoE [Proteobacteria bacterium]|nr:NADH-quinone oxidoreductase subunit NuoE [Pseudomonadota bacterium]